MPFSAGSPQLQEFFRRHQRISNNDQTRTASTFHPRSLRGGSPAFVSFVCFVVRYLRDSTPFMQPPGEIGVRLTHSTLCYSLGVPSPAFQRPASRRADRPAAQGS